MGTGKTITSIAIAGALYNGGKIRRVLVVAPLSILGVWDEEFAKFAAFDYTLAVLAGSSAKKADTLRHMSGTPLQVAVINYESAWRLEKEILAWHPDLVIADEGHKIKTHNISASKAMHKIGTQANYRLLLTGTVITNKAIDVFSQYKFLNPAIFGSSYYVFRNRYFDMVGYGNHTPVLKRSMEQELMRRIHCIAYRATKEECLDLPATTDIVRHVDLEPAAVRLYRDLVKESYAELGKGEVTITNILTRLLRLSQLTGGFLGDDAGSTPQCVSGAKMAALDCYVYPTQAMPAGSIAISQGAGSHACTFTSAANAGDTFALVASRRQCLRNGSTTGKHGFYQYTAAYDSKHVVKLATGKSARLYLEFLEMKEGEARP